MKIGLVCPYSLAAPGGVQNHVIGLAAWLASAGHDVSVLAPDEWDGPPPAGVAMSSSGPSLPLRHNGSVARLAVGVRPAAAVAGWLRDGDFDVVHVHEPLTPGLGLATLRHSDAPVVGTFHAARPDEYLHELSGVVLANTLDRIDAPIAVSAAAARLARAALGREPEIIPNGVDVSAFPLAQDGRWRGGERPRVSFLGRDEPRKGLAVFLEAAPRIQALLPGVDIVVATGESRPVPPGVRLLLQPDDEARNALLAGSDVYVAPNTGRESFGIVLIEALACGARVVASDIDAFQALFPGESGGAITFFPVGDSGALADMVSLSARTPVPPQTARSLAGRYDWSQVGPQIVARYSRLAGAGGSIA